MSSSPRKSRSRSRSRSASPAASASPARSRSRSRARSASPPRRARSASGSPARRLSRSPADRGARSRSRSRSRSGAAPDWKHKLDRLIDRGYIDRRDLDGFTMDALETMPAEHAECAVQRFSEANFARISNKSGFLMGIVRRIQQDGPDRGGGDLDELARSVRHRLRDLMDDNKLAREDVDARMIKALAELPSDLGLEAVEKFAMASLDTVRSKTGFMMGIIKRIQAEASGYGARAGGYGAPPAYGGGGYGGPPRGGYGGGYGGGGGYGAPYGGGPPSYGSRYGGSYGGGGGGSYRDRY